MKGQQVQPPAMALSNSLRSRCAALLDHRRISAIIVGALAGEDDTPPPGRLLEKSRGDNLFDFLEIFITNTKRPLMRAIHRTSDAPRKPHITIFKHWVPDLDSAVLREICIGVNPGFLKGGFTLFQLLMARYARRFTTSVSLSLSDRGHHPKTHH
jgi:hypothetical protein